MVRAAPGQCCASLAPVLLGWPEPPAHEQAVGDGDLFWLYVVENAHDDDYKIYCIQNPASRIDYFGFDGGWKDVAEPDVERDEADSAMPRSPDRTARLNLQDVTSES